MLEALKPSDQSATSTKVELPSNIHRVSINQEMTLHIAPGVEIAWEEFLQVSPNFSIALDGFVRGAPQFDLEGRRVNFNHHQEVNRLATRSTSGQVLIALKQGMMETFRLAGNPKMNLFVNDPDQDSSLAVWLLSNHERIVGTRSEPLINKLVFAEDLLDTTAGAYPFDPNSTLMRELAWVFEPYVQSRLSGRIREMQGAEMANVIDTVCNRISRYTLGEAQKIELDTRFETLGGGKTWHLIQEHGFYARTALFARGVTAFISFKGQTAEQYHYSIGKMSPFVPFPIEELYQALNYHENLDPKSGRCWSGSDIIGGSPRIIGSSLTPNELEKIVNTYLEPRH